MKIIFFSFIILAIFCSFSLSIVQTISNCSELQTNITLDQPDQITHLINDIDCTGFDFSPFNIEGSYQGNQILFFQHKKFEGGKFIKKGLHK